MGGKGADSLQYRDRRGFVIGLQSQREVRGGARFIRSGLFISRRGAYQADTAGNEQWLNLTYAEVPMLVGLSLIRRPRLSANVLGGLQAGMRLGCSFDYETGGLRFSLPCDHSTLNFKVKSFDFSAVAGGGLSFPREQGTFHLSAHYGWGFSSIDRSSPALDLKNRGASFTIAYAMERQQR
jgi:hypothetical protein